MIIHAPAGTPFASAASRSPVPIACCVKPHSGAPRKTHRLPDLKQSAIDSTVMSGLSSDTTPITPIGTRTRLTCNPSGRSHRDVTAPTGSGRSAIMRRRSTISLISSAVMRRRATAAFIRSFMTSASKDFPTASTSFSFAARILSSSAANRFAIARKAFSLTGPDKSASFRVTLPHSFNSLSI